MKNNINYIPRIPSLHYITNNEACNLPIIGAAGITVIFAQSSPVNVTVNNITIGDFKSSHWTIGSIAGGMLIIFLNGMRNSHVPACEQFSVC